MSISFIVMSPVSLKESSTNNSFSTFFAVNIFSASSSETLPVAVTRSSLVMTSATCRSSLSRNRKSRRVRIPTSVPSCSTIGTPETLCCSMRSRAAETLADEGNVTGFTMIPFALRFTLFTSSVWLSTVKFLWMMPIPPIFAKAIAMACSVTVSIGELSSGMFSRILSVRRVLTSTSDGTTSLYRGSSKTSSNVIAVYLIRSSMCLLPIQYP